MLCYQLEGSGPPLLLIHGWGVTYATWQNLLPLLKAHFQLVLVELPGYGRSAEVAPHQPYYPACAEAIEELRRHLGIEQWSILAYSTGTRVAEAYLQYYSTYVSHTIFLCPLYLTEWCSVGIGVLKNIRPSQRIETLRQWVLSDWRLYSLIVALGFNGHRHTFSRTWKQEIEMLPPAELVRMLCELPDKGRRPFASTNVPTLFIWGARDSLTARPRHPRPNDVFISANHSAPILAATTIYEIALPFLQGLSLNTASRPVRYRSSPLPVGRKSALQRRPRQAALPSAPVLLRNGDF